MPKRAGAQSTAILPPEVEALAAPEPPAFEMPKRLPRRLPDDPVCFVDDVTPEQAATWLKWCNPTNRVRRDRNIRTMAADMVAGDFEVNGEALKFDKNGILLDGQNRLFSCVEAGVPFRTVIVLGAVAQETMDAGATRTIADDLKIRKELNSATMAGLLKRVAIWDHTLKQDGEGNYLGRTLFTPSKKQQLRLLYNPSTGRDTADADDLRLAVHWGARAHQKLNVSGSCLSFCFWLFSDVDLDEAIAFFEKLMDERDCKVGEQAHVLREVLRVRTHREHPTPEQQYAALIILAWNAYMEGRQIKKLTFRVGGAMPDRFPQPLGLEEEDDPVEE
jgi:hypothetical protein